MYGRGSIVVATRPNAATVPTSAVQVSNRRAFAFVVHGNQVERREIETGVDNDEWLEVTRGLAVGEEVVIAGADALSDKATVRVARNIDPISGQALPPRPTPTPPPAHSVVAPSTR